MKKFAIFLLLFSVSCVAPRVSITNNNANSSNPIVDGKLFSTAWQQRSAEYRALCYQAFNIAKLRIDQSNREKFPKPKAIMTDIEETIMTTLAGMRGLLWQRRILCRVRCIFHNTHPPRE